MLRDLQGGLQPLLLFRFQIGQLDGRGEGQLAAIHLIAQGQLKVIEADEAANRILAHTGFGSDNFISTKIRRNLRRIFSGWSASLSFYGFQLHLIGFRAFARQNIFSLEIAIHHDDDGFIIIKISDDNRHFIHTRKLTGTFSPVSGDDFIAAILQRTRNRGNQYAVFLDTLHSLHHAVVVHNAEGVIFERMQLAERDSLNLLMRFTTSDFLGGKEIIVGGQTYVSAAVLQDAAPPLSARGKQPQPCRRDHVQRCSCPRH